ncbi:MAG TPA: CRISPR-associated endonuclease Cas2 [Terriglobia bacterium]|nr:CRISPR-associated endonuclease Cas2 [Terriglobia bacterium]
MSLMEKRNWLIAYDIRNPRRLSKVHRYLKRHAIPVQYSVFVYYGNSIQLDRLLSDLASRIEAAADDVRAYHLPDRCEVAMLGRQSLPEGIIVGVRGLDRLLRELTPGSNSPIVEAAQEADDAVDGG